MPPAGIVRGVAQAMAPIVGPQAQFAISFSEAGHVFKSPSLIIIFAISLSLFLFLDLFCCLSCYLSPSLPSSATFLTTVPQEDFEASAS